MKNFTIILFLMILTCCSKVSKNKEVQEPQKVNYGHNIIILTDLSNRVLQPKSIHDTTIIFNIIDKLKPLIEESVELNIDDKFKFYSINQFCIDRIPNKGKGFNFHIDMSVFDKKELDISNYLYGRIDNDYKHDISTIKSSIKSVYDFNNKSEILGADIWHYLNDQLNNTVIDTTTLITPFRKSEYLSRKKNKVIIITDGYIEAGRYSDDKTMFDKQNPNKTKYLSSSLLKKFRNEFNKSSYDDVEKFFNEKKYGLVTLKNPLLSDVELLVLEIDDRTIVNGMTTVSPTDSQLIKLFWSKWVQESGIESSKFQIHNTFKNERDLELVVSNFLNN
jgi:hypothetical protein